MHFAIVAPFIYDYYIGKMDSHLWLDYTMLFDGLAIHVKFDMYLMLMFQVYRLSFVDENLRVGSLD